MRLLPFQELLDRHGEEVYRFLVGAVGPLEADDCFQETFLAALRAYGRLDDGSNLRGWLLTIARRKAIDEHRARARRAAPVPAPRGEAAAETARRAASAGLVDVAYATVESPFGPLVAAVTPRGLVRVAYPGEADVLDELADLVSPRVLEAPARVSEAARQLEEYFEGRRRRFDLPVDWSLVRGFSRRVLRATARIPYGRVRTYAEVAAGAGSPRAYRAAGNALASNPVPIVVPCHRVVRSGGRLGGYTGGLERKEFLLRLEGVAPPVR